MAIIVVRLIRLAGRVVDWRRGGRTWGIRAGPCAWILHDHSTLNSRNAEVSRKVQQINRTDCARN